jgi:hypothetical protein
MQIGAEYTTCKNPARRMNSAIRMMPSSWQRID